jgi:8-oxo-dGTP pyrophosphatase MutT (NUDIX family)
VPPNSPSATTTLYRPTSRVLVLDPQDRLLLLRCEDPALDVAVLWCTPGGALDAGESYEQAALRELWEETGIAASLGPCVWSRRHLFRVGPRWFDVDERYFVVRVQPVAVAFQRHDEYERATITGHRWWSLDELSATSESIAPRQLAALLPPILAGQFPPQPLHLPGRRAPGLEYAE